MSVVDRQGEDTQEYQLTGTTGKRSLNASESSASGGGKRARPTGGDNAPRQVQCRHLLIKHSGSRFRHPATGPTSSNPLKHKEPVTRSKDEALKILQGHLGTLKMKCSASTADPGIVDKQADMVRASIAWAPSLNWTDLQSLNVVLYMRRARPLPNWQRQSPTAVLQGVAATLARLSEGRWRLHLRR